MKPNFLGYLLSIILVLAIGGFAGYGITKHSMQEAFDEEVAAVKAEYGEAVSYASVKLKECTGRNIILEEKVAKAVALAEKPAAVSVRKRSTAAPPSISAVEPKPAVEDPGAFVEYEYLDSSNYASDPVIVDYDPSVDSYVFADPVVVEVPESVEDDAPVAYYDPELSSLERGDDDYPYDIYFGGQTFLWHNGVSVGFGATWAGNKMSYSLGYLFGVTNGSPYGLTLGVSRKLNLGKK